MSKAWLRDLEEKVDETSRRLRELQAENTTLRARVAELEAAAAAPVGVDVDEAAWRDERDEIRRRVEALVQHLESLLGAADGD